VASIYVDGRKVVGYARSEREAYQRLRELRRDARAANSAARPRRAESVAATPSGKANRRHASHVPTVREFADQWIAASAMKSTTEESYRNSLTAHIFPFFGQQRLDQITAVDIAGLIAAVRQKVRAERTVQYAYSITRSMLQAAVAWELITDNPALRVKRPPARWQPRQVWTLEQANAFVGYYGAKRAVWHDLFIVALLSGLRLGELLGLDWGDFDWEGGTITVRRSVVELRGGVFCTQTPKSRSSLRCVHLPTQALDTLRCRHVAQKGPVFRRPDGNPPRRHAVATQLERARSAAGVPYIGFHGLRHQHVSLLAFAGVSVKAAQERVGHSSPAITLGIYTHVLGDEDVRTAQSLGGLFHPPRLEEAE
jgi:integrase